MVDVKAFYEYLAGYEIEFFSGVPDSLLKDFCAYIKDNVRDTHNITAANEGNALAMASGYYLATGKPAVVYMQNSGLGNVVNPLASLTDKLVYSIPALLLVGWRGEPGKKDEPQHKKQGIITVETLEVMGIKHSVIGEETTEEQWKEIVDVATTHMKENNEPYAIVVKKGAFSSYKLKKKVVTDFAMTREEALTVVVEEVEKDSVFVSTTGMASRELFEIRERRQEGHEKDFLTVGSMGHASQIALGIALAKPERKVYCIDGDGAVLMHMGGMAIIGAQKPKNFVQLVINNGAHDSVGGQPTVALGVDFVSIAKSCGYSYCKSVSEASEIKCALEELKTVDGPSFLEIKVNKGAREDLGRPTTTPIENKNALMEYLK